MIRLNSLRKLQGFRANFLSTIRQHPRDYVRAAEQLALDVWDEFHVQADIADDWPLWASLAQASRDGFGVQIRFRHGPARRHLKILWDHPLRAMLLRGVDGIRNGPILATFYVTDTRADVAAKMRAGLAAA